MGASAPPRPATVAELLRRSRYEVIPLAGAEEQVLEYDPRKQVPSYLEDDRLADPAARERWERYAAERREAEAAAER